MKKMLVLVGVVIVFAGSISFGVARWTTARAQRAPVLSIHDSAWLGHELKLTDSQTQEIEKLEAAFAKQLTAACADHCAARLALGDALEKSPLDAAQARACVEKMNAVQSATERATFEHILKVRTLLDDQQAQRFSQLIRQQVCNMPMGAY